MAYSYSHLYGLPCTAYRFFTVYGPWGRPDMAPYRFLRAMMDGQEITVFNRGRVRRAFTYVDDVVECVCRGAEGVPASREDDQSPRRESPPYRILNVGSSPPVEVVDFIRALEEATGLNASLTLGEAQPGDMEATEADVRAVMGAVGYAPTRRSKSASRDMSSGSGRTTGSGQSSAGESPFRGERVGLLHGTARN